jgi:probable rRNA maturation factor
MASILFFSEQISFKVPNPRKTTAWIKAVIKKEKSSLESINYIFCSDEHLRELNIQYLNHKTFTDIITFNYGSKKVIEGEIYISVDRIKENADKFGVEFNTELRRVIIHGVLHLMGYNDKSKTEKALMRKKEDSYLSLWS